MLWRCFYLFCPLDNSTHQSSPCPHKFFTINYCIATRSSWEKRHFYIQKKLVYHPYTNVLCWNSALFHTAQTDFNLNWLYGPLVPIEVCSKQGFSAYTSPNQCGSGEASKTKKPTLTKTRSWLASGAFVASANGSFFMAASGNPVSIISNQDSISSTFWTDILNSPINSISLNSLNQWPKYEINSQWKAAKNNTKRVVKRKLNYRKHCLFLCSISF